MCVFAKGPENESLVSSSLSVLFLAFYSQILNGSCTSRRFLIDSSVLSLTARVRVPPPCRRVPLVIRRPYQAQSGRRLSSQFWCSPAFIFSATRDVVFISRLRKFAIFFSRFVVAFYRCGSIFYHCTNQLNQFQMDLCFFFFLLFPVGGSEGTWTCFVFSFFGARFD